MKYKSIFSKQAAAPNVSDNPPYSIPDVIIPQISVYDDLVDKEFHQQIWKYLLDQKWHHKWASPPDELQVYRPSDWDDSWINAITVRRGVSQPRTLFASDEHSLQQLHPLIYQLWEKINQRLDNKWTIAGVPEGSYYKDYPCPATQDPNMRQGWRVYANASMHDLISGNGYAHRDNKDLHDDKTATIIWMASPVWYPSWGGELVFYPEDHEGVTGDHQQFNSGDQQQRNFRIGWADEGKIVSLKPNRLLVYDGRTLHSSTATRHRYNTELQRRIVFRARLKDD